jgi:uncharacterized Rossmann fold enzyme
MRLEVWLPIYEDICKEFGFDKSEDISSARMLASMLGNRSRASLDQVKERSYETVLVCGGGESLADDLSSTDVLWPVVAADSATTVVVESGVRPDIIVTDLDGIVEDQIEANSQGVPVFIHAHGDNKTHIKRYVGSFPGPVVGTCQCAPPKGLFNFGGFTDGDRAACISAALGAKTIFLAGFDFKKPASKPGKDWKVKLKKLVWARRILDELANEGNKILPVSEYRG